MGTYLSALDETQPSGHVCADCGEPLGLTDEVWMVGVAQPHHLNNKVFYYPVLDEEDGGFMFEPFFFCFDCWEGHYAALREEVSDDLPVEDAASASECLCCGSGIRDWEYAGVFTLGEFRSSRRSPNGVRGAKFVEIQKTEALCLYCLVLINTGHIEMWDDVSQFDECADCIQMRCWRYGSCDCYCHTDQG
jgi:hypothetical protein